MQNNVRNLTGKIILATERVVKDILFDQAAMLVVSSDERGDICVLLNCREEVDRMQEIRAYFFDHVSPDMITIGGDDNLGGRIDQRYLTCLHREKLLADISIEIIPGVWMIRNTIENIQELNRRLDIKMFKLIKERFLVYVDALYFPYGSLQSEIEAGYFKEFDVNEKVLFFMKKTDIWPTYMSVKPLSAAKPIVAGQSNFFNCRKLGNKINNINFKN